MHTKKSAAFVGLHVEEEGDYGIALPAGVAVHVLETGHDDHDHGGRTSLSGQAFSK